MRHTAACLILACAAPVAPAQTVTLNGSMGNQALLVIDGLPRVLTVGATTQGVKLLSVNAAQAEVLVGGERKLLQVGAGPVRGSGDRSTQETEIVLAAGTGGHFISPGHINGKPVSFMVDTGASAVAIAQGEADRLGLDYKRGPSGFAQTANGRVPVHMVVLNSVRVGNVEVANVEAIVMPASLDHILLGNSFLTRFSMKRDNDTMRLAKRPN